MQTTRTAAERIERAIVASLLRNLSDAGFKPTKVEVSGDEEMTTTETAVLTAVFETYSAASYTVRFEGGSCVVLVTGNGEEIVSDYSDRNKAFSAVVDAFDAADAYRIEPAISVF